MRKGIYGYGAEAIPTLIQVGKYINTGKTRVRRAKERARQWRFERAGLRGGEASRAAVLSSELTKLAVKYPALFSRFRPAFRGAKKDTAEAVSFRCFALRSYAQGVTFTLVA